jgi:hypothetical protein
LVFALDIDPHIIATAKRRAAAAGLANIRFLLRDFIARGSGLADGSADYAMLFNILHCSDRDRASVCARDTPSLQRHKHNAFSARVLERTSCVGAAVRTLDRTCPRTSTTLLPGESR